MYEDDPGWQLTWRSVLVAVVPGMLARQNRKNAVDGADLLVQLRQLFLAFVVAIAGITLVVAVIFSSHGEPEGQSPLIAAAFVGGGVGALVAQRLLSRPLDGTTDQTLVTTYRTRFFLRLAFGEIPALVGFVGFFVYDWWLYPIGLVLTAMGFAFAAPTVRSLQKDQDDLIARGCPLSLVAALRSPS